MKNVRSRLAITRYAKKNFDLKNRSHVQLARVILCLKEAKKMGSHKFQVNKMTDVPYRHEVTYQLVSADRKAYEEALQTRGGVPCVQIEMQTTDWSFCMELRERLEREYPQLVFDVETYVNDRQKMGEIVSPVWFEMTTEAVRRVDPLAEVLYGQGEEIFYRVTLHPAVLDKEMYPNRVRGVEELGPQQWVIAVRHFLFRRGGNF